MSQNLSTNSGSSLRICIIGNQAFSLLNFRGPLISDMVERGHEVLALAPDYDEETRAAVRARGAKPVDFSLSRTGLNPLRDMADMLRLAFLLYRLKPDITFGYTIKPAIYSTLASWLVRIPRRFALITGLGYAFTPTSESLKRRLLRHLVLHLYRAALKHADEVFFQNDDDRALFVEEGVVREAQSIRVNGTGVDLEQWQPAPPVTKPATFLLVGRLLREKGIMEYAKAACLIRRKYPETRFILLGGLDSNPGALSRAEVEALVNDGMLEWTDHVPDVRSWIARSSVFVLPSYYREGVPRSIQEAMAMARPVITTDAPGCRNTVIHGENGFLIPTRNSDALAEAMEQFVLKLTAVTPA